MIWIIIYGVVAFILGFFICAMLVSNSNAEDEDKIYKLEKEVERLNKVINSQPNNSLDKKV